CRRARRNASSRRAPPRSGGRSARRLERLQTVVAERHVRSAPRLAGHAAALLLAVFHFLRHQHNDESLTTVRALRATWGALPVFLFATTLRHEALALVE